MAHASCKIWTVGHSTRSWDEFVALLAQHGVEAIADVRRFPASRKHPHFNAEALEKHLPLEYRRFPELGGRRRARPDSRNAAWRNASFRGYADYMETEAFAEGAGRLLELAQAKRTALLCAEAVWWRCHRALIADWLKARGCEVLHILDASPPREHPFTAAAAIVGGRLSYEGGQPRLL